MHLTTATLYAFNQSFGITSQQQAIVVWWFCGWDSESDRGPFSQSASSKDFTSARAAAAGARRIQSEFKRSGGCAEDPSASSS